MLKCNQINYTQLSLVSAVHVTKNKMQKIKLNYLTKGYPH